MRIVLGTKLQFLEIVLSATLESDVALWGKVVKKFILIELTESQKEDCEEAAG